MLTIILNEYIVCSDARTKLKEVRKMNIKDFRISEEYIDEQAVIYARRIGLYGAENIVLMEQFKSWIIENGYMTNEATILGIARDDAQVTEPDQCRYDVCLLGEADKELPDWINEGQLESGKYCVVLLPHTAEVIGMVWQAGIQYLADLGYELDSGRAIIERYKKKLVDEHMCEMMFPIK